MNNTFPLITIITPCYNYGIFLPETLNCLLAQTYTNWECIIINDGSKDNTEQVALKYANSDHRFRYIYQENIGLAGARNNALSKANGDYIQLLDADDLLEPEKLQLQVDLLESQENISLVYSSMMIFKSDSNTREYRNFILPNNVHPSGKNEVIINAFLEDTFFLPGCVFFRKELYNKTGNFNESLYGLEDWNYWSRAALLGFEFYSDQRPGTRLLCRDHDANMSKAYEKMLKSRLQARTHIIQVTEDLKLQKKLQVSNNFIDGILKKHHLLLLLDEYQYYFHYENKWTGIKALIQYSLQSGKPLYIFEKLYSKLK